MTEYFYSFLYKYKIPSVNYTSSYTKLGLDQRDKQYISGKQIKTRDIDCFQCTVDSFCLSLHFLSFLTFLLEKKINLQTTKGHVSKNYYTLFSSQFFSNKSCHDLPKNLISQNPKHFFLFSQAFKMQKSDQQLRQYLLISLLLQTPLLISSHSDKLKAFVIRKNKFDQLKIKWNREILLVMINAKRLYTVFTTSCCNNKERIETLVKILLFHLICMPV